MNKFAKIAALSVATIFALPISGALAVDEHYISDAAVVGGYDVVAYHTAGKPTKGSADFSATYQGATWHFASADNQALFKADPAKYAPAAMPIACSSFFPTCWRTHCDTRIRPAP